MKINKKQLEFIVVIEKCRGMFRHEVNTQKYPGTLIDALIVKGVISEFKNRLSITNTGMECYWKGVSK